MSLIYTLTILAMLAFIYQWFARISLDNPRFKDGLIYGMCGTFLAQSLVQDVIGQEAYINLVTVSWVSGWYTIPLAVIGLLIMAGLLYVGFRYAIPANEKKRKEEAEQNKKDNK